MPILTRPLNGRILTGVAVGVAELYGLSLTLVRVLFIAGFLAQPFVLLLYLLLAISSPSEDIIVSQLQLSDAYLSNDPRKQFERLSDVLMARVVRARRSVSPHLVAFLILLLAAALEIPRIEGIDFYSAHPFASAVGSLAARFGSVFLDVAVAIGFLLAPTKLQSQVVLSFRLHGQFRLEEGKLKSVGGLAAAVGRLIRIDPAYVRMAFVLLNLLTFGLAGVIYLIIVITFRKRDSKTEIGITGDNVGSQVVPQSLFRGLVAGLFIGLAILRLSTEFRLFFFNEPFFQGLAFVAIGLLFALRGIAVDTKASAIWLLAGAAGFLIGIEELSIAIFRVQLTLPGRFEMAYAIAGLALIYYVLVRLTGRGRRTAIILTLALACAGVLVELHVLPIRFLTALVQFYDFFYPLIFAGLGLWLVIEK